jgi:D-alanine-D-alanine ligase
MKIALTYDLRSAWFAMGYSEESVAEFDRDDTIDAIEGAIRAMGHETVRVGHVFDLVKRLAHGETWDLVFNIAECLHGFSRESLIPALLDAYRIPCTFSDPLCLGVCLHKALAKQVVSARGVRTPAWALVEKPADADLVDLAFPLFAKPVAEGTSKGITALSVIENRSRLRAVCEELIPRHRQPVLVEEFLPGREFTVGIVGSLSEAEAVGALEVTVVAESSEKANNVYSYETKEKCEEMVSYDLPNDADARAAVDLALHAWNALGCLDSGRIDVRFDSYSKPCFIEANPLAGLHPLHSDLPIIWSKTGRAYNDLIARIVTSAARRAGLVR